MITNRVADILNTTPAEDIPYLLHAATSLTLAGPPVVHGPTPRTYFLHPHDFATKATLLRELFEGMGGTAIQEILADVYARTVAEFRQTGYGRSRNPDDPYWYEESLIANWRASLEADDPVGAAASIMNECNHGHSGFVAQVARVYMSPRNDRERQLSAAFRQLHIETGMALLQNLTPAPDLWEFMNAEMAYLSAWRLGHNTDEGLITSLKQYLATCTPTNPACDVSVLYTETLKRFL